jgi:GTP cyclohydrolase I
MPFDQSKIKKAVRDIIEAIGEDPDREGFRETPRRVAEMYEEIFNGINMNAVEVLTVGYEQGHREMVVVKDISFYSMCEHHLLPFFGTVHVGYIPDVKGRIVGISKLARVVDIYARRPQVQERMTTDIANSIMAGLKPTGVAVVVQAEHMCMEMRGVKKPGSKVVTSAIRGWFLENDAARNEFLSLVNSEK